MEKSTNLMKEFQKLSADDQIRITHFFNLHNAASYIFDSMSESGRSYTMYCIELSQTRQEVEQPEEAGANGAQGA